MTPEEFDALLAQIAARTDALRIAGGGDADAQRLLVADLARAVAQLRTDATAIGDSLARAIDAPASGSDGGGEEP